MVYLIYELKKRKKELIIIVAGILICYLVGSQLWLYISSSNKTVMDSDTIEVFASARGYTLTERKLANSNSVYAADVEVEQGVVFRYLAFDTYEAAHIEALKIIEEMEDEQGDDGGANVYWGIETYTDFYSVGGTRYNKLVQLEDTIVWITCDIDKKDEAKAFMKAIGY